MYTPWQVNSGSGWSTTGLGTTPYSGNGTNRLTVNNSPTSVSGNTYRVIVGNGGACPNDTSSVFTLNVTPNAVAPTFTAGTTTICLGGTDTYTATTTAGTVTYSIVGGTGASINSTTGVVSSVTGNFTVRATATTICGTATTDRAVTVNPAPSALSGGDQSICYTGGTITGASASNYGTITWTTSGTGTFSDANVLAPTYTPSAGDIGAGIVTLTFTASNPGCTSAVATKDVTILSANTWVGSVSTDWFTAANWCLSGAIPTATTDVIIPNEALTNFDPLVNGVGGVCQNININASGIIGIAGTNNLDIYGDWNNSGTFNINSSTVTFRGSTNTNIGGFASPQPFYNLTINKGTSAASVTTTADVDVANLITITQGQLVVDVGTVVDMGSVSTVISTNGTLHVNGGDATGNGINASGTVNMETGTLGIANTVVLTAGTFNQTGGVVTLNTAGVNTNSNAVFTADANANLNISGGSVIFERANAGTGYDVSITSGSGTKTITGGTFQFGNATTPTSQVFKVDNSLVDFNNVTINSANAPTLRLISNVAINSTGVLSPSSVLDLNQKLMLVNNNSASAITRSGNGYVLSETQIGSARLVWNIGSTTATNYVFPLGNAAGEYMPLTMRLNSGNIGFAGVSSFKSVNVSSGNWPTGSEQVTSVANPAQAIQRFWHLESSASPSSYNADVTFSFHNAEDPTIGISSVVKMQRYNKPTNSWDLALAGQVFNNTNTRTVMVPRHYQVLMVGWWK
ncbi:MAG: hypothetical protein M0D57_08830 [Sphingobacteriales bacterium JAD_PAG50586_3]|nr:MAG: hypothetical protein M0D57_08830 [Sphingobacteriales bacterium JAD_PAG50586_3]